jgi:hypothetical protein
MAAITLSRSVPSRKSSRVRVLPAAVARIEPLEARQLLSASAAAALPLVLAPASVANATINATISTGTAPLDTAGTYTIQPDAAGNFTIVNAAGGAHNSSGSYTYSRTSSGTGVFHYTDLGTGLSYNDTLSFTSATAGTYSIAPVSSGASGAQVGSFTFTPAAAPVGPDLTIDLTSTPTGSFVGGDKGRAIVHVANAGTTLASGGVMISLSISPTGSTADSTPVAALTRQIRLKPNAGMNVRVPVKFPSVATNNYFFVATVAPVPPLTDIDTGNNTAVSAQSVTVGTPFTDLETSQVIVSQVSPAGVVSGSKARAVVSIKNVGNQPVNGPATISLSSADNAAGTGATPILGNPLKRSVHLKPGATLNVPVKFSIPTVNAQTNQFIFATLDTTGGTIVESDVVNGVDANNTIGTTTPLTVGPAVVTLRDAFVGNLPPSVVGGSKNGRTTLQVFNDGNTPFRGTVPITLAVSMDTTIADGQDVVLATKPPHLFIAAGKSQLVRLRFTYPAGLANANYFLLAQTGATTTPVKGAVPPMTLAVPPSNVAVAPTQVDISQPFVTLNATFGTLPGTAFTAGQKVRMQLTLLNNGNVPAKGPYTVQLLASPSMDPNDPGAVALTATAAKRLSLKANSLTRLNFRVKIPNTLATATPYFVLANILAPGVNNITDPNVVAVSPTTFTVT